MLVSPAEAATLATTWSSIADLGGGACPLLAIDLRGASRASIGPTAHDALGEAMHSLPWVNLVAIDPEPDHSLVALIDTADVVVSEADGVDAEVAALAAAITASPQASVALVQLLRLAEHTSVEQAVHAESLTYGLLQSGETFQAWLAGRNSSIEPDDEPAVLVDRRGGLLTITLNRPDRRNALNVAMRDGLVEALELLDLDRSLDGALLVGNGSNFSAGGDLDEFGTTPSAATGHHVRTVRSLPRLVHHVRDRLRVHVHGTCVGAGIELPAFAHAVIADPDASFRLPEIGFGLVPGAGGTVSVSRRCGRQRTAWWALRGIPIDTATALSWGLVDRIAER